MPDTDKILEAEQSILNLASELKRIRDAADLLENTQSKSDSIISAAQSVVQTTEQFSANCGAIVTKLASTDLSQKLESLHTLHAELQSAKSDLVETMQSAAQALGNVIKETTTSLDMTIKAIDEETRKRFEVTTQMLGDQSQRIISEISKVVEQLNNHAAQLDTIAKGSKMRQTATMVFAILTFICAMTILITQFIPNVSK